MSTFAGSASHHTAYLPRYTMTPCRICDSELPLRSHPSNNPRFLAKESNCYITWFLVRTSPRSITDHFASPQDVARSSSQYKVLLSCNDKYPNAPNTSQNPILRANQSAEAERDMPSVAARRLAVLGRAGFNNQQLVGARSTLPPKR